VTAESIRWGNCRSLDGRIHQALQPAPNSIDQSRFSTACFTYFVVPLLPAASSTLGILWQTGLPVGIICRSYLGLIALAGQFC
jgi:hypothetical protein